MEEKKYHHGDLKNALIKAGIEILSQQGISALSLRKVATKAGVSHAAPYAHFKNKQDLIASISSEGFNRIYEKIFIKIKDIPHDLPEKKLKEAALAYLEFALTDSDHFRITFSGIIEKDKEKYPEYIKASKRCFSMVQDIVRECQQKEILRNCPLDEMTMTIWSLVHGFVSLLIDNEFSHNTFESQKPTELLLKILNQITLKEIK
ncbi:MAG: TetR/AcrR family transcriptional regulator [Spirochaetales bacterium]|jgi:AcrR family transcriptional regulator|nr:TetR/AcrR family transcriptional regulator [Exilispira sp.]NMC67243.1 TetR/AcrR family transcriptional regulator [Spirochaetales bacterium]